LPARPKLLSEGGNRSGKDNFKFFFGGRFFLTSRLREVSERSKNLGKILQGFSS